MAGDIACCKISEFSPCIFPSPLCQKSHYISMTWWQQLLLFLTSAMYYGPLTTLTSVSSSIKWSEPNLAIRILELICWWNQVICPKAHGNPEPAPDHSCHSGISLFGLYTCILISEEHLGYLFHRWQYGEFSPVGSFGISLSVSQPARCPHNRGRGDQYP